MQAKAQLEIAQTGNNMAARTCFFASSSSSALTAMKATDDGSERSCSMRPSHSATTLRQAEYVQDSTKFCPRAACGSLNQLCSGDEINGRAHLVLAQLSRKRADEVGSSLCDLDDPSKVEEHGRLPRK